MQWDMQEEHSIYDKQKEQWINHLCDIFDDIIDPLHSLGYMFHDGYCVDVFETDGQDYEATIRDAIRHYQEIYVDESVRQKEKERIDNCFFESKFMGVMSMEDIIRNFISAERYFEEIGGGGKLSQEEKEHLLSTYEEGLQKVLSELHCIGDDPVKCYKITEGINLYDDIISGTYFGIVFSAQYFICGNYIFLLVWGTSE